MTKSAGCLPIPSGAELRVDESRRVLKSLVWQGTRRSPLYGWGFCLTWGRVTCLPAGADLELAGRNLADTHLREGVTSVKGISMGLGWGSTGALVRTCRAGLALRAVVRPVAIRKRRLGVVTPDGSSRGLRRRLVASGGVLVWGSVAGGGSVARQVVCRVFLPRGPSIQSPGVRWPNFYGKRGGGV